MKDSLAIAILFANEILLSSRFPSIRQRFFNMPKVHSTATLVADKALLKAITSGSLVAQGNGIGSQEAGGYALSPTK